jgi:hypothetical protein
MLRPSKILLLVLFFGGLIGLGWAEYAGVSNSDVGRIKARLVVPDLLAVNLADVGRVEVESNRHKQKLVFVRRENKRWDMIQPLSARANSARLDSLLVTLRQLTKSADTGTIAAKGNEAEFGLAPPEEVVRLFGKDTSRPIATLDLGKLFQEKRYVRGSGSAGIDVIDPRLLGGLDAKPVEWRQRSVFTISPMDVQAISLAAGADKLKAVRQGGRWDITEPTLMPGDEPKLEGLAADLVGLEVTDGENGFVEDHANDLGKYGLKPPRWTFELIPKSKSDPETVLIGNELPGEADRRYACIGGTRDVVIVKSLFLRNYNMDATRRLAAKDFRSRRLANFDVAKVSRISVQSRDPEQVLQKAPEGWKVIEPSAGRADNQSVVRLLTALSQAKAVELRSTEEVKGSGVDQPSLTVTLFQPSDREQSAESDQKLAPSLTLKIGARDPRRNLVYSQVGDDPTVLSLDLSILDAIPRGPLAFRDRTILSLANTMIDEITIQRPDKKVKMVGGKQNPTDVSSWKMTEPTPGEVDHETLTRLAVMLLNLRADALVDGDPKNLAIYGLDSPPITVSWSMIPVAAARRGDARAHVTKSLFVGGFVPPPAKPGTRFAKVSGNSMVFTLIPEATQLIEAEMRKHRISELRVEQVQGLTLRWDDRQARFERLPKAFSGPDDWKAERGSNAPGIDATQLNPLMTMLANLTTNQFVQYDGPMRPEYGLAKPRLSIDVTFGAKQPASTLRIGNRSATGQVFATVGTEQTGAVFLLPGEFWEFWATGGQPPPELPKNLFAR